MTAGRALAQMTPEERELFTDAGAVVISGLSAGLSNQEADNRLVLTASMLLLSAYLEVRIGLDEEDADWYATEMIAQVIKGDES